MQGFLDLLLMYLQSTYVSWNDKIFIQKEGVCIGSCVAPALSDLFLGHLDRLLADRLQSTNVIKVYRFVDDFLVLLQRGASCFEDDVALTLAVFKDCLSPLQITHETPEKNALKFLDIRLTFSCDQVCWGYAPRSQKPLLPFDSAHTKLVKRSVATMCFTNALKKSCVHQVHSAVEAQVSRLRDTGYPEHVIVAVCEAVRRREGLPGKGAETSVQDGSERRKTAVIPYLHGVAHRLKKIGQRAGVRVVMSAPLKLARLCKETCPVRQENSGCNVGHNNKYVECDGGVVYRVPLACGRVYVGQTGRCINSRLREHQNNVLKRKNGNLSNHCAECQGCEPYFSNSVTLFHDSDQRTREIVEAAEMQLGDFECVSTTSIALSVKEAVFLKKNWSW